MPVRSGSPPPSSCARGQAVHVDDRHGRAGELLTYGIPGFKRDKAVVTRRLDRLRTGRIVFRDSFAVGRDATLAELRARHRAAGRDRRLPRSPCPAPFPRLTNLVASNSRGFGNAADSAFDAAGKRVVIVGERFAVRGSRFAVRNSGAVAVVEGCGANGCEYMTGGSVVVLGTTGVNFGAGMSGGMAFVYDSGGGFPARANPDSIVWQRLASPHWEAQLHALVTAHVAGTGSRWARGLLDDWDRALGRFWQVVPKEMLDRLPHPLTELADAAELPDFAKPEKYAKWLAIQCFGVSPCAACLSRPFSRSR